MKMHNYGYDINNLLEKANSLGNLFVENLVFQLDNFLSTQNINKETYELLEIIIHNLYGMLDSEEKPEQIYRECECGACECW